MTVEVGDWYYLRTHTPAVFFGRLVELDTAHVVIEERNGVLIEVPIERVLSLVNCETPQ